MSRDWLLAHLVHPAVNLVTILVNSGFHFARLANYFGIASTAEDFSMSAAEYTYKFGHLTKPLHFYFCDNINQDLN
jgi:hypothetical protein